MHIHLLRPLWLLALVPLIIFFSLLWRKQSRLQSWRGVCDAHLLPFLLTENTGHERQRALVLLFISMCCTIMMLSGPAWKKNPVPTYQTVHPVVVLADLSEEMQDTDVLPSRWKVAQFKLHDIFQSGEKAQYGLIAFTAQPFIVSPLTDDPNTIELLLRDLSPKIMPVGGYRLHLALKKAEQLTTQAGFLGGQILVITGETPGADTIREASRLREAGFQVSIMPMIAQAINPLFARFAQAGGGEVLPLASHRETLKHWMQHFKQAQYHLNHDVLVPIYRDDGRWFLIPALLFLWPVFRRGFLERIVL